MLHRVPSTILSRSWLAAALILAASPTRVASAADAAAEAKKATAARVDRGEDHALDAAVSTERINELIQQLGHPRYTVRRTAANELRRIGPEAFDLLHAATGDADPEVAASARYLLRQITVRWVRSDDSPAVRRLLLDYGDQAEEARSVRVSQLARLSGGEGVAGLCRIARYDRSPLVSRQAALAIIRPDGTDAIQTPVDPDVMDQELGPSTRVAATWLRQYLRQLRDPAAAVASWQALIVDETARLDQHVDETSPEIVLGLLWNVAELYRQLGNKQAVIDAVDRMVALDEDRVEQTTVDLLSWFTKHQSWDILDEFLSKHQVRLEQAKRPLYFVALARAAEGQSELAEQLAERAAGLDSQAPLEGFWTAKELEERGKFDWSVREYRRVLDTQPINRTITHEAILARIELANMLFDHEQHQAAAEALEPFVKALQGDDKVGQLYAEIQRYDFRRYGLALPDSESLACRYHFYRAGQYRNEQDWQRERDELKLAIGFDKTDADVLIAMYRVPEADDQWRASTRQQIAKLCQQFQQEIDEAPSVAMYYNQWAWLVSNTEGDFQKAVRYSHRSLELNTSGESAEASYLDTLGRCYYAVGDYENAVKYERQALEKVDHMQVMHRQLALFEKALAEKQGAAGKEQGAKNGDSSLSR